MVWVKIDDSILDNPKIIRSGPVGFALHTAAITWCARNLTDGFVPEAKAKQLLSKTWADPADDTGREVIWELNAGSGYSGRGADEVIEGVIRLLVHVGLWHEGSDDYGNLGYWLNDFTEFNPTRAEVLHKRTVRAEAGKAGGERTQSKRQAKPRAKRKQTEQQNSTPVPDPVPVPEPKEEDPPTPLRAAAVEESGSEQTGPVEPASDLQARCAKLVANPTEASYRSPQSWPELVAVAEILHRSLNLAPPKLGDYSRDSGVRAMVGLYADGRTLEELSLAAERAEHDEYCQKFRLKGCSMLTPAVVSALLSQENTAAGATELLRLADGGARNYGPRRGGVAPVAFALPVAANGGDDG